MDGYPFNKIEDKWRNLWDERGINRLDLDSDKPKKYVLVMFSYPSEKKLHIGHWWNYSGTDIYSRFMRLKGFNVFEPMGFDAFGLPAENFAIKHGIHPAIITRDSIKLIREQLKLIGAMFDWSKEVNTSQPDYYKWTQWLFLQLYKKGAAYQKKAPINWCPQCMTVLANEQVKADGSCDRCDALVENRDMKQWFFRITDFADDLLNGLDDIDWPESTKTMQRHWIGRSEGTEIQFKIDGHDETIHTFTTRPDTLFGVTYVVLAPENELVQKITSKEQAAEVSAYIRDARSKSDIERLAADREKTGVFTGAYVINPATNEKVPVWTADYVLASYGTGAVMAVPAHDQRDYEFAHRYGLPLKWVIDPVSPDECIDINHAFEKYGIMHDSGRFSSLTSSDGKAAVTKWLTTENIGKATVSYRLRDWSVSRQRYWGAPIPIIHCDACGAVPVPESDLPVELPEEVEEFKPRGTSPLGAIDSFINTSCPKCGKPAKRDPDTMDTFVDSSWYFLRYTSTEFHDRPFDKERLDKWLPIDVYIGGPEHATGHLIYFRYITKFLQSIGMLDFSEPARKMVHQGIITYNGQRMSKSKGNVVNPDEFVSKYGADCFRLYLMFMGDYTIGGEWSDEGIIGVRRFQNRVWRLIEKWAPKFKDSARDSAKDSASVKVVPDSEINRILNHTIKEVSGNLESFQFNTAISRIMELVNALYIYTAKEKKVNQPFLKDVLEKMTLVLSPLAPHMSEELWEMLGYEDSLFNHSWPSWDEKALQQSNVKIAVQVNGKLAGSIEVPKGSPEEYVVSKAMELGKVQNRTNEKPIRKKIYVKDRILNIVV